MDVKVFNYIRDGDKEKINYLTSLIQEQLQDPSFIFTLCDALDSEDCKSDEYLQKHVAIQISNCLRLCWWRTKYDGGQFYDDETRIHLVDTLIGIILKESLSFDARTEISYAISYTTFKTYPHNSYIPQKFLEVLSANIENYQIVILSLNSVLPWFITAKQRIAKFDESFDEICINYFPNFTILVQYAVENISTASENSILLTKIIEIIMNMVRYMSAPLDGDQFMSMLNSILPLISLDEGINDKILSLKESIWSLFLNLNEEFLCTTKYMRMTHEFTESREAFANSYREIAPQLFESFFLQLTCQTSNNMKYLMLRLIRQYLVFGLASPGFVDANLISVILQFVYLDDDTINDPENNPEYYESFLSAPSEDTIRGCAKALIDWCIKHTDSAETIVENLVPNEDDDPLLLDAKAFLLDVCQRSLTDVAVKEFKHQKEQEESDSEEEEEDEEEGEDDEEEEEDDDEKEEDPDFEPDEDEEYKMVSDFKRQLFIPGSIVADYVSVLSADAPPYLYCSALYLLIHTIPYCEPLQGCEIGLSVVRSEPPPIIIALASKLFSKCYTMLDEKPEFDSTELITAVIGVAQEYRTETLKCLVKSLTDSKDQALIGARMDILEIFMGLLKTTIGQSIEEDDSSRTERLICTVYEFIDSFNENEEALIEMAPMVYQTMLEVIEAAGGEVLSECPEVFFSAMELLEIFSLYIKEHPVIIFESVPPILEFIQNNDICRQFIGTQNTDVFVWWLYPLIVDAASPFRDNAEFYEPICQLVIKIHAEAHENADGSLIDFDTSSTCLPYLFTFMSILMSVYGPNTDFINAAVAHLIVYKERKDFLDSLSKHELKNEDSVPLLDEELDTMVYPAIIRVLATFALASVDEYQGLLNANPFLLEFYDQKMGRKYITTAREMTSALILLLQTARLGHVECFERAAYLLKSFKIQKERDDGDDEGQGEEKEDGEEEEEEDDFLLPIDIEPDEPERVILPYEWSIDSVDVIQLFKTVAEETSFMEQIDEGIRDRALHILSKFESKPSVK